VIEETAVAPHLNGREVTARIPLDSLRAVAHSVWTSAYGITVTDWKIAMFKVEERYVAVERYCPHRGADLTRFGYPRLAEGRLMCTAHAHEFDLTTGVCARSDSCRRLRTYATRMLADRPAVEVVLGEQVDGVRDVTAMREGSLLSRPDAD
jgi:nitrite reductase/ring-hydroxylating ferredoxin subunit